MFCDLVDCIILPRGKTNMNGNKCDSENSENCSCSVISEAIYSIIKCLIVFIVVSVLRLVYLNLR